MGPLPHLLAKKFKDFEEERNIFFLFPSKFLKRGRGMLLCEHYPAERVERAHELAAAIPKTSARPSQFCPIFFPSKFLKRGRGGKTFFKKFFPRHIILN